MSKKDRAAAQHAVAGPRLDRRAALARLGLFATAAYVAPALTALSSARASSGSWSKASHFSGSSCSGSGSCGSHRHRRRHRHRHGHFQPHTHSPLPPPRPYRETHILFPRVEVIIRP